MAVVSVVLVDGARSATHSSGQIAFARGDGIYVMRPDGSGVRVLRRGVVGVPVWSPDGRRIAFTGGIVGRDDGGILVMNADGSGLVRLVEGGGSRPTWSPDGRRIAFSGQPAGRGRSGVWVMNADGSNLHRISTARLDRMTFAGWGPFDVDWSSTGRLVFTAAEQPSRCMGWGPDIYVMNLDGSDLRKITPGCRSGEPHDPNPDWSPDGRRIAYARDSEIWVMNADGRSAVQLTHTPGSLEYSPAWSPDGRRIAVTRLGKGIYVINADGTHTTRLTAGWNPDWRPATAP